MRRFGWRVCVRPYPPRVGSQSPGGSRDYEFRVDDEPGPATPELCRLHRRVCSGRPFLDQPPLDLPVGGLVRRISFLIEPRPSVLHFADAIHGFLDRPL